MAFKNVDLIIFQGGSIKQRVAVLNSDGTVRDLTGYNAKLQIRSTPTSVSPLVTLTDGGGGLEITALSGTIDIVVANTTVSGYTFTDGVWDLRINASTSDTYEYLCGGNVHVRKMVTQ
jgi:hypothetical protein